MSSVPLMPHHSDGGASQMSKQSHTTFSTPPSSPGPEPESEWASSLFQTFAQPHRKPSINGGCSQCHRGISANTGTKSLKPERTWRMSLSGSHSQGLVLALTVPCHSWSTQPPPGWGRFQASGSRGRRELSPCFCLTKTGLSVISFIPVSPSLIHANLISHLCSLPCRLLAKPRHFWTLFRFWFLCKLSLDLWHKSPLPRGFSETGSIKCRCSCLGNMFAMPSVEPPEVPIL